MKLLYFIVSERNIYMGYLIGRLSSMISSFLIIAPTTLIALIGHELAHGFVSTKLGDPTPKMQGRMTLNPLKHLDPVGTVLMLLTGFGWAKPVEVNPMYYKDRKKGMALVALAGPIANFLMALAGAVIGLLLLKLTGGSTLIATIVSIFVQMNLNFMVFNLIPLPPLDGSKILGMFLPNRTYYTMLQYERYSIILIMLLSLGGAFGRIIGTGTSLLWNVIWSFAERIVF